jgi:hypothetical protein
MTSKLFYLGITVVEKPTGAFVLSLIGGVLVVLFALVIIAIGAFGGAVLGIVGFGWLGGLVIVVGVVHLIFGVLMIVGSIQMNSGVPGNVKTWSIIVLVVSVIGLIMGAGLFIGAILGLVGAILGLVWKPSTSLATQQPPTSTQTQ